MYRVDLANPIFTDNRAIELIQVVTSLALSPNLLPLLPPSHTESLITHSTPHSSAHKNTKQSDDTSLLGAIHKLLLTLAILPDYTVMSYMKGYCIDTLAATVMSANSSADTHTSYSTQQVCIVHIYTLHIYPIRILSDLKLNHMLPNLMCYCSHI